MVCVGFNVVKDHIFYAVAEFGMPKFDLQKVDKVPYSMESGDQMALAFDSIKALLKHLQNTHPDATYSFLASSAGQYGSSVETIKAEGILQLAARHIGIDLKKITPQSLPKRLGIDKGVKWKPYLAETYNAEKKWKQFGSGGDGAVAAAIGGALKPVGYRG